MQWIDVMSLYKAPANLPIYLSKIKIADLTYTAKFRLCFCDNSGVTFYRFYFSEEPFTLQNIFINNAVSDGFSCIALIVVGKKAFFIAILIDFNSTLKTDISKSVSSLI